MTCARRPAGARKPAPPTLAAGSRRSDLRFRRACARLSRAPAFALLLGALGLFAAAPAQAQTEDDTPGAPINLNATGGTNAFTATWTKRPTDFAIASFQFRYRWQSAPDRAATTDGDPATGWWAVDVEPKGPGQVQHSHTVRNLGHSESFYLQVRATYGAEEHGFLVYGPWSERGAVTTNRNSASGSATPQPPGYISARSDSDGGLTLSWAPEPGKACYDVRHRTAGGAWSTPANVCAATWTGSSLSPGDSEAQVRSVYPGGNASAWSDAVSVIVKGGVIVSFDFAADSTGSLSRPTTTPADAESILRQRLLHDRVPGFHDSKPSKVTVKLSKALTSATTVTLAAVPIPGADPGPCDRLPCNRLYKNLPLTVAVPASTTSVTVPFVQSDRDDHADDIIVDDVITDRWRKGSFGIRLEKVAGAAYSVDPAARATVHVDERRRGHGFVRTLTHYEVSRKDLTARAAPSPSTRTSTSRSPWT